MHARLKKLGLEDKKHDPDLLTEARRFVRPHRQWVRTGPSRHPSARTAMPRPAL